MEITVPASPPRTTAPRQVPSHAQVDKAITNMVMQIRQTGAPTSTVTSSQRDSQASGTDTGHTSLTQIPRVPTTKSDPPQASGSSHSRSSHRDRTRSHRQPVFPAHETTILWTAPGAQPRWRDEEPESLEDIEESIRHVAGGATDVATEPLIRIVAGIRAQMDEGLQQCEGVTGCAHVCLEVRPTWPCAASNGTGAKCLEPHRRETEPHQGAG